jgi:hypothetical protein
MPLDKATQHSLGLFHGLPSWWKKRQQHQETMAQRQRDTQADADLKATTVAAAAVEVAAAQRHHMKQMSAYEGSMVALSSPREAKIPIRYVTDTPRPTRTWDGEQRQQRQLNQFQAVGAEQGLRTGECIHMPSLSRGNDQASQLGHG